jgi:transposase-like protein
MVAKTYVCEKCNKTKLPLITEPLTYVPKCHRCGDYMVEGDDE